MIVQRIAAVPLAFALLVLASARCHHDEQLPTAVAPTRPDGSFDEGGSGTGGSGGIGGFGGSDGGPDFKAAGGTGGVGSPLLTGCGSSCEPHQAQACCSCGANVAYSVTQPQAARGLHLEAEQTLPIVFKVRDAPGATPLLEVRITPEGQHQVFRNDMLIRQTNRDLGTGKVRITVDLVPNMATSDPHSWSLAVGARTAPLLFDIHDLDADVVPGAGHPAHVEISPSRSAPAGLVKVYEGSCPVPVSVTLPTSANGTALTSKFFTWDPPPGPPMAIGGATLVRRADASLDEWSIYLHAYYAAPDRPRAIAVSSVSLSGDEWTWREPGGVHPIAFCEPGCLRDPSVVAKAAGGSDMVAAAAMNRAGDPPYQIVLIEDVDETDKPIGNDCGRPLVPPPGMTLADLGCTSVTSPSLVARAPAQGGHVLFFVCHHAPGQGSQILAWPLKSGYTPQGMPQAIWPVFSRTAAPIPSVFPEVGAVDAVLDERAPDKFAVFHTVKSPDQRLTVFRTDATLVGGNAWDLAQAPSALTAGDLPKAFRDAVFEDIAVTRLRADSKKLLLLLSFPADGLGSNLLPVVMQSW
jgi:hypothetical protein